MVVTWGEVGDAGIDDGIAVNQTVQVVATADVRAIAGALDAGWPISDPAQDYADKYRIQFPYDGHLTLSCYFHDKQAFTGDGGSYFGTTTLAVVLDDANGNNVTFAYDETILFRTGVDGDGHNYVTVACSADVTGNTDYYITVSDACGGPVAYALSINLSLSAVPAEIVFANPPGYVRQNPGLAAFSAEITIANNPGTLSQTNILQSPAPAVISFVNGSGFVSQTPPLISVAGTILIDNGAGSLSQANAHQGVPAIITIAGNAGTLSTGQNLLQGFPATIVYGNPPGQLTIALMGTGAEIVLANPPGVVTQPEVVNINGATIRFWSLPPALTQPTCLTATPGVIVIDDPTGYVSQPIRPSAIHSAEIKIAPAAGSLSQRNALTGSPAVIVIDRSAPILGSVERVAFCCNLSFGDGPEVTQLRGAWAGFIRFLRIGNHTYGVMADGLYEIGGEDFDGQPVDAHVTLHFHDYDSPVVQRCRALRGVFSSAAIVQASTEDAAGPDCSTRRGKTNQWKAEVPRGLVDRFWAFKIKTANGKPLKISSIEPEFDRVNRRVA